MVLIRDFLRIHPDWKKDAKALIPEILSLAKIFADPGWQKAYGRFRPMIESGHREIFSVVG